MLRASIVLAAALAGAVPLSAQTPAQTLRIGMQADPATLDPAQSVSFTDRVVMAAVCDKLIELDAKLNFVPQLATEWAWAPDGLARSRSSCAPSVVFHDGEPLDAEAVRFNFERNNGRAGRSRQTELEPRQVGHRGRPARRCGLELSEPNAPLMARLADRAGMMVSPEAGARARRPDGDGAGLRRAVSFRRVGPAGPYRCSRNSTRTGTERGGRSTARSTCRSPTTPCRLSNLRAGTFQHQRARGSRPILRPCGAIAAAETWRERLARLPRAFDQHRRRGEAARAPLGVSGEAARGVRGCRSIAAIINHVAFERRASFASESAGGTGHPFPLADLSACRSAIWRAPGGWLPKAGCSAPRSTLLIGADPLNAQRRAR